MNTPRYLEEISVGEKRISEPFELTEADSVAFALRYDPQPMHVDRESSDRGPFHGLIASGWQTTAIVMSLIVGMQPFGSTPLLGLGVDELRWPIPVRPGDRITGESEVISITASKSKPQFGIVRVHITGRNQNNEVVLSMFSSLWIAKRPAA
jgi:acyl dehydratase